MSVNLDVVEVYDTVTNSWSVAESLPDGDGAYLHAGVVDGKLFVLVSCALSESAVYSQDLYMYNLVVDVWTKTSAVPEFSVSGVFITLAVVDDEILVMGEYTFDAALNARYNYKVMIYNPKTELWCAGASGDKVAHLGAAGATVGLYAPQKVYILGLTSGTNFFSSTNRVYDSVSDAWSYAKDMPTLRKGFGIAVVDDILYVVGGYTSDDFSLLSGSSIFDSALNEQYVPIGYGSIASGDGDSGVYEIKPFSSYLAAAIIVITISASVAALSFYSKIEEKRKDKLVITCAAFAIYHACLPFLWSISV
ncbi:MAG: hypothetical protein FWF66_01970 [Candidatus Bathyarchaeota archaeon]|nr:hypothetical protein [Candidatus Termiticorpusculum sp.]